MREEECAAKQIADNLATWREQELADGLARIAPRKKVFKTLSGHPTDDLYTPQHVASIDYCRDIGFPGRYPFTRGVHASMYRGRPWTIRQVAGYGRGNDTNMRYKYLLKQGETGLSTDFDLPTLLGYDSDHPDYSREVGKIGVAVDTVEDVHELFSGIPLDAISTSLTINASAAALIAMYAVVARETGVSGDELRGTAQNDILKEYTAQNEFIYPPEQSVRLVVDSMHYCSMSMPQFNPVSVSGYHIREAGATADQEIALTLSAALTYLEAARRRGIAPDVVAPRLSFFFGLHNDFLEEIAKLRAARRLWSRLAKERLGCENPLSCMLRTHVQTAGVALTAQQPLNNVVRVTLQALAAVLGGAQSLHTNSLDEALQIPSEEAIRVAIRTQQIILHESGAADVIDALGGSFYIERATADLEEAAMTIIRGIDEAGGLITAIETGMVSRMIADSAWEEQCAVESGDRVIVGVNHFLDGNEARDPVVPPFTLPVDLVSDQLKGLREVKRARSQRDVVEALKALSTAASREDENLMPFIEEAVAVRCTIGEIHDSLRDIWGLYAPSTAF